jgi:hypothetical protein
MTIRIEKLNESGAEILCIIGCVNETHLVELKAQMTTNATAVVDLGEVGIVDVEAVQFFVACEKAGIGIRNAPLFIREWMRREQGD